MKALPPCGGLLPEIVYRLSEWAQFFQRLKELVKDTTTKPVKEPVGYISYHCHQAVSAAPGKWAAESLPLFLQQWLRASWFPGMMVGDVNATQDKPPLEQTLEIQLT